MQIAYYVLLAAVLAACAIESSMRNFFFVPATEYDLPFLEYEDIMPDLNEHNRRSGWMTNVPGYILGLSRGYGESVIGVGFMERSGDAMASLVSEIPTAEWFFHDGFSRGSQRISLGRFAQNISVDWSVDPEDMESVYLRISRIPRNFSVFLSMEEVEFTDAKTLHFQDSEGLGWKLELSLPSYTGLVQCDSHSGAETSWVSPWGVAGSIKDRVMSKESGYYVPNSPPQNSPAQDIDFLFFKDIEELVVRISPALTETVSPVLFPQTGSFTSEWEQRAVSNLLGSLGRFQGDVVISDPENIVTLLSTKLAMTAIGPSRSKFPRPFLWDDGFHILAVDDANRGIAVEIVTSWLRAQSVSKEHGWIPRELALSSRDQAAIPAEFLAQDPLVANPPSILFVIRKWMTDSVLGERAKMAILGHLARWYRHLALTLKSSNGNGLCFRWKPRNSDHCLSSGLDDYPRGFLDNEDECHLDLHVWMMLLVDTIHRLATDVKFETKTDWADLQRELDNALKNVFSDQNSTILADYIGIQFMKANGEDNRRVYDPATQEMKNVILRPTHSPHIGYVTLFPLMTGRLCPQRDKLLVQSLLDVVLSENLLLSEFGVLSLAKSDPLFRKGENYWRGNIWANMNLLIIGSLFGYGMAYGGSDPELSLALQKKAIEIRDSFLRATKRVWEESKGPREYIDPLTGAGGGAYPFSGWTAAALALLDGERAAIFWNKAVGISPC